MAMPLLIYDFHIPLPNNHTLIETSPIHNMPDIYHKLDHSIQDSPLDISFYKMSAADMLRQHYQLRDPSLCSSSSTITGQDQHSSSSTFGDSSTSSAHNVTSTMPTRTKERSHRRLVRELRRLRSENTTLRNSVSILKEDLCHERESRQIAEQCHRRFFNDSMDTHTQLNLQIMDQQDQLLAYESRLNDTSDSSNKNNSRLDNGDLLNDDHVLWGCEDMDCSNEQRCYSDPHSDFDVEIDEIGRHSYYGGDIDDDGDDDDDRSSNNDQRFEDLAISYLRQALISNWTSTRANLEFDDLILKHDPSPERVLRALAEAFLKWIQETIEISIATLSATSCTTTSNTCLSTDEKTTCVARLMTTQVQDMFLRFWKNILERYVHNDEDQYQFLQQAERTLHHRPNHHYNQQNESYYIVQNFHRLLVMLYKYDIVDGDAVVHWWHDQLPASHLLGKGDGTNDYDNDAFVAGQLRDVTRTFVEWVDEEDVDDDDDNDGNDEDLYANCDGSDYQYDSELDVVINSDDDEYVDDLFSELLEPGWVDDSNVSRTPIQPVERKKKSVIIQV